MCYHGPCNRVVFEKSNPDNSGSKRLPRRGGGGGSEIRLQGVLEPPPLFFKMVCGEGFKGVL